MSILLMYIPHRHYVPTTPEEQAAVECFESLLLITFKVLFVICIIILLKDIFTALLNRNYKKNKDKYKLRNNDLCGNLNKMIYEKQKQKNKNEVGDMYKDLIKRNKNKNKK